MTASVSAVRDQPSQRIAQQILDLLSAIPVSREHAREDPRARVAAIALAARRKAFLAASALALPPGPIGWLTVLPELVAIWKIQSQMVADIAAACGRNTTLTREQMLYCLFRQAAAQAVRDLAVRTGQRWVVHATTTHTLRSISQRIGVRLYEHALGSGIARMLPVAGALGVGAYAWYDTRQVARTAIAMFSNEVEFIPARRDGEAPARSTQRDRAQDAREAGL